MNQILQLKGKFLQRKNTSVYGPLNLPKNSKVTAGHVEALRRQLQSLEQFWLEDTRIGGALISVHYTRIVPKSSRLQILLGEKGSQPNQSIRGAKFIIGRDAKGTPVKKHVFTYFVSIEALRKSIHHLEICEQILMKDYNGEITETDTEQINKGNYDDSIMKKSAFLRVVTDVNYVEEFTLDRAKKNENEQSLVTLYKTGIDTKELLKQLGLDPIRITMVDDTTLRLDQREMDILHNNVDYLIATQISDFSKIVLDESDEGDDNEKKQETMTIPDPTNQPTIGVIDTHFDDRVYFHKWVDYRNCLQPEIDLEEEDFKHGTAVTSLIVDGPALNPKLEDNCGRFKVRHFGVAKAGKFSSFLVLKMIHDIVRQNRDIKVWNLSLGSDLEIDPNFISPEAAELDRIQSDYDVIFVVAGTNRTKQNSNSVQIGAPADSLNSLVVNAVDFHGRSASYTRKGPVLSFFYKPDICYYGGDKNEKMTVYVPFEKTRVMGTSVAAPWITRKLAYLIHVVGLSREIAKALIIDSAAEWNPRDMKEYTMGYGIVPIKIDDILHSRDDEIRFIMSGTIDEYETYTYNIPVPQNMGAYPFFVKTTLAYFPRCDRNQGVDYTNTEMDIHFGRIIEKNGRAMIKAIDNNKQADEGPQNIQEEVARKLYRKWDNIKHVSEAVKESARPRKAYENGAWGLSIKTKERLAPQTGRGMSFGVVITLKEMYGENRIDDFIKLCMVRGWLVNKIDVQNQIDIYNKAEEEIEFT